MLRADFLRSLATVAESTDTVSEASLVQKEQSDQEGHKELPTLERMAPEDRQRSGRRRKDGVGALRTCYRADRQH